MEVVSLMTLFMAVNQQVICKSTLSHFPQGHMGFLSTFGRAHASTVMSKPTYSKATQA